MRGGTDGDPFRFEGMFELPRIDMIVLDSISRLDHRNIFQSSYSLQHLDLNLSGKSDGDPIRINQICRQIGSQSVSDWSLELLTGIVTFGLEPNDVT